jgi:hypothetical protein
VKLDPRLKRFLCFGLIGTGALAVMSGVVNIIGAWQLLEPSDEQSLGITRHEVVGTYAAIMLGGALAIYLGLRWRK